MKTACEPANVESAENASLEAKGGTGGASLAGTRLRRERRTIAAMLRYYCRDQHGHLRGLCPECQALLDYASLRLARCRFGEQKPTCANCPVHCYQPQRREQIKAVMRQAGPRMLLRHPILALLHLLDGRRRVTAPTPPRSS